MGKDGKQILVKHGDEDRIHGGLLRAGNEEQREGLDEHGKERVRDETQATREVSQWRDFNERAFEQYRNADSVQIRLTVDYLKGLAAERDSRKDKGEMDYYINDFDNVAAGMVKMRQLTR